MRLYKYLPVYYQKINEFCGFQAAEEKEITELEQAIALLPRENALLQCGESMVAQWERFLKIDALGDLKQRKMFLLATLRGQGKLNEEKINQIVNAFTGATQSALVDFVDSRIRVRVLPPTWGETYIFSQIAESLLPRIPAHLQLLVEKYYYTWVDIKQNHATWLSVKGAFPNWEQVKTKVEEVNNA